MRRAVKAYLSLGLAVETVVASSQVNLVVNDPKTIKLAKSKGFAATWKKQTSQTTGYELQYSTSSSFAKKTTKLYSAWSKEKTVTTSK